MGHREGPQARKPSKCLNGRSYGELLAKEAFPIASCKSPKKACDRAIAPGRRQSVSPHTWHCQGPRKPSRALPSRSTLTGAELPQVKRVLHLHAGSWVVSDSLRPCGLWPTRLLCQGGVLQARILKHMGQYWLPYPSGALFSCCPSRQLP